MSTAPNGWQNPKTNWASADVPLPTDFNRIESNLQAIETGQRMLDPSQTPSGDSGSLRQLLDWFANRLKAITGATNWYDAPATTLAAAKSHIDATSGIHGATSSATANRIIIRDSAGRAKVAAPSASDDIARLAEVQAVQQSLTNHANATSVHGATSSATAARLVIRDSAGRAQFATPSAAADAATKGYVDGLVGSLQAGTAFAYYLTPPNVELASNNIQYDSWWVHDGTRSVVVRILLPGTIRYHVQYRCAVSGDTTYVRILQNGSQIRQVSTSSASWQTATGNITVSPGDIITIQKRFSGGAANVLWQNVRIETAQPPLGIQPFLI